MLENNGMVLITQSDESWFWGLIEKCIRHKGWHPRSPLELLEFLRPGEENRCRRVLERLTRELTSDVLSHPDYEQRCEELGLEDVERYELGVVSLEAVLEGAGEYQETKDDPLRLLCHIRSPLAPYLARIQLDAHKWNEVEAGRHLIHPSMVRQLVDQGICEEADLEGTSYLIQ